MDVDLKPGGRPDKEELAKRIEGLKASIRSRGRVDVSEDLRLHQLELEMQNLDLVEAQRQLEEARDRYAELFDFAPIGYIVFDSNGVITEANLTAAGLLSVERGHLLRTPFFLYVNAEDKDILFKHMRMAFNEKVSQVCEMRLKRKVGGEFHARIDCLPFVDAGGGFACRAAITDITESKRAEEALRIAQEERLRSILDNSTTAVYVKDAECRYLFINRRLETILRLNRAQIKGKTDYCVFPKEMADALRANDLKVIESNGPVEFEEVYAHDDGPHTYLSVKFPLYDMSGRLDAVCSISTDISERKRIEQEQLKIQKIESLGILAGGIAHDFNNLMTGIIGNLSLLEHEALKDEKSYRIVLDAEKAASRAKELVQQILTFSRGGHPIKATLELGPLIKDSAEFALSGSNVKCVITIPYGLWPVDADAGQISQVINNLAINACQAMPEGGILEVTAENRVVTGNDSLPLSDGRYVMITVENHGTGILQEILPKIFDPYFTTRQTGNGLGLASVYSIIKKHGGYIGVTSKPGVGTAFMVYLPASENEIPAGNQRLDTLVFAGGKILVMDDEKLIRDVASEILTCLGYEVVTAMDGSEVIGLYKEAKGKGEPFDVIVVDLTVPGGMGGKEAVKKILDFDPGARVVVSSGFSSDPIMADYKKYGFRGVIPKPYTASELGSRIHEVMTAVDK